MLTRRDRYVLLGSSLLWEPFTVRFSSPLSDPRRVCKGRSNHRSRQCQTWRASMAEQATSHHPDPSLFAPLISPRCTYVTECVMGYVSLYVCRRLMIEAAKSLWLKVVFTHTHVAAQDIHVALASPPPLPRSPPPTKLHTERNVNTPFLHLNLASSPLCSPLVSCRTRWGARTRGKK